MLILAPVLILLATASALVLLQILRPRFRYGWLMAVGTAAVAWIIVGFWQPQLPISAALPFWRPAEALPSSPALSVDGLSWPYSAALISLVLAVLLTAPVREGFPAPKMWVASLSMAALGLLAVAANNSLTLVLVWATLDLAEIGLLLSASKRGVLDDRAMTAFCVRLICISLLLLEYVLAGRGPGAHDFASSPAGAGLLLLAVAALRLGVLPVPFLQVSGLSIGGSVGTTLELTSAASSLVLLSRVPWGDSASPWGTVFALILPLIAVYAGWMWLRAPDAVSGRGFGVLGIASLALASALRGSPGGATGWGVALILAAGAMALSTVQNNWLNRALLVGAWSFSSLPFSLTATAWRARLGGLDWMLPILLMAQALLVTAFVRQATRPRGQLVLSPQSSLVNTAYQVGIVLLLAAQVLLGFLSWDGSLYAGDWIPGIVESALVLALLWALPRIPALSPVPGQWMPAGVTRSTRVVKSEGQRMFLGFQAFGQTITAVLEGEAGIMWSLLLLVLFVSLISGGKP